MRVSVLACEIDDMNPQIFGAVMDRLYEAGALEVFYQPVQMKKNRPGTLMTVVCGLGGLGAAIKAIVRVTRNVTREIAESDRREQEQEQKPS